MNHYHYYITFIYLLICVQSTLILTEINHHRRNNNGQSNKVTIVESIRDEEVNTSHRTDSLSMLILITLLIISVFFAWLFRIKHFKYMHVTGVSMLLGIAAGGFIRLILYVATINENSALDIVTVHLKNDDHLVSAPTKILMNISKVEYVYSLSGKASPYGPKITDVEQIEEKSTFNPEIFFYVLLPPIVFYAGYQLHRSFFFRNIGAIFTLAFAGTLISSFSVGGLTYLYANYIDPIENYSLSEGMLFGAIISATDPVTVLAIFDELKVDVDLHALVFGESLFNDAVAIVLYRSIQSFMISGINPSTSKQLTFSAILDAIIEFSKVFFGSFIIGISVAILTAILTKVTRIDQYPLQEVALLTLMSYTTFLLAEVASWSGIVAILFCGIAYKHYTYVNMSSSTALRFVQLLELTNFLAETFIFSYIGLSVFLFNDHCWNWGFIGWTIVVIQISRVIHIYPLCGLLNMTKQPKIPCSHQHALSWSGLRGAMAFALAIRNTSTPVRRLMLTSTLSCVIFSVIIQGGFTGAIISFLKIKTGIIHETENEEEEKRFAITNIIETDELDAVTAKKILTERYGIDKKDAGKLLEREGRDASKGTARDILLVTIEKPDVAHVHVPTNITPLFKWLDNNYIKPALSKYRAPKVDNESSS